jgi:hypothetical protein
MDLISKFIRKNMVREYKLCDHPIYLSCFSIRALNINLGLHPYFSI